MWHTSMDILKKQNKTPWKEPQTSTFPSVSFSKSFSQDDICSRTHKSPELGNFLTRPCFEENEHCLDIMWVFLTDIIFTLNWMVFVLQEPLFRSVISSLFYFEPSQRCCVFLIINTSLSKTFPGYMRSSCASEKCIWRVGNTFVVALAFKCSSLFSAST